MFFALLHYARRFKGNPDKALIRLLLALFCYAYTQGFVDAKLSKSEIHLQMR